MAEIARIPSLKKYLLEINIDVDDIEAKTYRWNDALPISDIEFYTIMIEDRRYYNHYGIDLISVLREFTKVVMLRKHGGASTIDMQYVRTITGNYDKRYSRKIREALISFIIHYRVSKTSILRTYLDIAYFGSGLIGVESASQKIFSRSSTDLKGFEAAFIAAMLVSPRPHAPSEQWVARVSRRADYALKLGLRLEKRFQKIGVR